MKSTATIFILFVLLFGLISISGNARTITFLEAEIAANHHLLRHNRLNTFSLGETKEVTSNGIVLAYAFDLEPEGYIVISASTSLPPVVAYSYESGFGEPDDANPLFRLVKTDLTRQSGFISSSGGFKTKSNEAIWERILNQKAAPAIEPLFEQWPATGDGWLKTNWTQSPPYNDFCPMDPVTGLRSYAGCPATAMAQILNFHANTNNTLFSDTDDYYHNYAGRQYWIDDDHEYADFPSYPELNIYLDTLKAHYLSNTALSNEDKAALTFACGVAARQVFTSQGSGTFGVNQAYDAYLRFGCLTVELLDSNNADLYERLKQNIKDTLPAHLAIVDESWSTGHNVVVDGYNTDDYYHLNFGWGGSYNGWYLIPDEIPYELTVIEGIVVDIMKNTITGINSREDLALKTLIFPNPSNDKVFLNYELSRVSSITFFLYNISGKVIRKYELKDQTPGSHSFPVSMENQPAGIYFYTVQTGNSRDSGRIIRVK
jgi:hypothetical protein